MPNSSVIFRSVPPLGEAVSSDAIDVLLTREYLRAATRVPDASSLCFDARRFDDIAPLLELGLDVGRELFRSGRCRHGAFGEHAVGDVLLFQDLDDLFTQALDDRGWH